MDKSLKPIKTIKNLEPGTIIRRISDSKDQQGSFLKFDEEHNMILANIIDMATGTLLANEAVLKSQSGDKIYYYDSAFDDGPTSKKAVSIVREWPLFKEHKNLQDRIMSFIKVTWVPEQIIEMSRTKTLQHLFVPLQQRFRIGRFKEQRDPERVCNDTFIVWLESLGEGKHITYLANIPHRQNATPTFYSAGQKKHEDMVKLLEKEKFRFDPSHGGHIRAAGVKAGKKHFIVDAGCNYLGLGVKTPLGVTQLVSNGLKSVYPEFEFTPLEGCGAKGDENMFSAD